MQHLNYCRQALVSLKSGDFLRHHFHEDSIPGFSESYRAEAYNKAVFMDGLIMSFCPKFILPDGGIIFYDKELRAISDLGPKLTYPDGLALEFVKKYKDELGGGDVIEKNIVLAKYDGPEKENILIGGMVNNSVTKKWAYIPPAAVPPVNEFGCQNPKFIDGGVDTYIHPTIISTRLSLGYYSLFTEVLWQFLNALACKNVHIEKSPAKSTKQGKKVKTALPFDDYHFLTVDVPGKAGVRGEGLGCSHRSPREHLRRGHIRRLESGPIWVNACVVNAGIGSKVGKSYLVRRTPQ